MIVGTGGNNLVGQLPSAIGNMQIIQDFNIGKSM